MSADSGPTCGLLLGSDPVDAIEQENEANSSPVPTIDHRKVQEVHAPCFSQPVLKRRGRLRERLSSTVGRPPDLPLP